MKTRASNLIKAIILVMPLVSFSGCASTHFSSQLNGVTLESVDSDSAKITRLYLQNLEGVIMLQGELRRRSPARGPIPGHLHVELIDHAGQLVKEADIGHIHKSVKSRRARFNLSVPEPLIAGSTLRVTHHDVISHLPDSTETYWRDVNDAEIQEKNE